MEIKAALGALSQPHGQPCSPAPSTTSSPFAVTRAQAPPAITPCPPPAPALPAAASSSPATRCFIFSNGLAFPNGSRCCSSAAEGDSSEVGAKGLGWSVEVVRGCAASSRGVTSTRVTPRTRSDVLRELGMEMELMEELSPPLKPVLDATAGDMPLGIGRTKGMAQRRARAEQLGAAHTLPRSGFANSFPSPQQEASSVLPHCQLFFSLCFYRKSQFPQIIQLRVRKKKYKRVIAFSSLSHTQGLKAH